MNTTSVQISTKLYNSAVEYARQQNTSVEKVIEGFILTLPMFGQSETGSKLRRPTQFSRELLDLVGIVKSTAKQDDINGDELRWEFLKEKYAL